MADPKDKQKKGETASMSEHDLISAVELQRRLHPVMVEGDHTFASVSDKIGDVTLKKRTPFHWFIGFAIAFMVAQLLLFTTICF